MKPHHDGVFGDFKIFKLLENSSDIEVEILAHRESTPEVVVAILHSELFASKAVPVFVRHLHGGVRGIVGEVGKEWSIFLARGFHEGHRFVGKIVDAEPFSRDDMSVPFKHGGEVVAPVAATKSVEKIKATAVGVVGKLHSVVPLAKRPGGVAVFSEEVCNGGLVEVHSFATCGGGVNIGPGKVASGEKLGSGRGANRADEKVVEAGSIVSEGVDIWGLDVFVSRVTEISPTLIV